MSKWADNYIKQLQNGETVQFRPRGGSMTGRIESGQLVTVEPLNGRGPQVGDAVLCKVEGRQFLHLVKAIEGDNERFQIGNNKGRINGWTKWYNIYGIVTKVED